MTGGSSPRGRPKKKKPGSSTASSSGREETREELLRRTAEERAHRKQYKHQESSALVIQAKWRAYRVLSRVKTEFGSRWEAQYGASTSQTTTTTTTTQVDVQALLSPLNFIMARSGEKTERSTARARVALGILTSSRTATPPPPDATRSLLEFIDHCLDLCRLRSEPDLALQAGLLRLLLECQGDLLLRCCGPKLFQVARSALSKPKEDSSLPLRRISRKYALGLLAAVARLSGGLPRQQRVDLAALLLLVPKSSVAEVDDLVAGAVGGLSGEEEGRLVAGFRRLGGGDRALALTSLTQAFPLAPGTSSACMAAVRRDGVGLSELCRSEDFLSAVTRSAPLERALALHPLPLTSSFFAISIECMEADGQVTKAESIISFLAFGSRKTLPAMWRWLAERLTLPAQAPLQATRGWNIASLRDGISGVRKVEGGEDALIVLRLFYRCLEAWLLVADDTELHGGEVFALGELRAIASTMNCLVCNAYLMGGGGGGGESDRALLHGLSGCCARLFDRDAKKRFCPDELWLAPVREGPASAALDPTPSLARQICGGDGDGGPISRLLKLAPWCFAFEDRVKLFRSLVRHETEAGGWTKAPALGGRRPSEVVIRRAHLLEDSIRQIPPLGEALRGRVEVKFINDTGVLEAGLDYGGLVKEYLEECAKAGFNPDLGLFREASGELFVSEVAEELEMGLPALLLLGMVVGKCLWDGILLDVSFAPWFESQLVGRSGSTLEDLRSYDASLYESLLSVKNYEGRVEDLYCFFQVEEDRLGRIVQHELVPGGSDKIVTKANVHLYVHLVAHHHLTKAARGVAAFKKGLNAVVSESWLRIFRKDLSSLLGGTAEEVDVDDLRNHTVYDGGFTKQSSTVKLFWSVVEKLSREEKGKLLKFVTSSSRPPVLGFASLRPPFKITKVRCETSVLASIGLGKDADRLPTASTCFNCLKLPNFKTKRAMREKLLYAIKSGAGFELS